MTTPDDNDRDDLHKFTDGDVDPAEIDEWFLENLRAEMLEKPADQRPYFLLIQLHIITERLNATTVLLTEEIERLHGMTPDPDLPPGVVDFKKRRKTKP